MTDIQRRPCAERHRGTCSHSQRTDSHQEPVEEGKVCPRDYTGMQPDNTVSASTTTASSGASRIMEGHTASGIRLSCLACRLQVISLVSWEFCQGWLSFSILWGPRAPLSCPELSQDRHSWSVFLDSPQLPLIFWPGHAHLLSACLCSHTQTLPVVAGPHSSLSGTKLAEVYGARPLTCLLSHTECCLLWGMRA